MSSELHKYIETAIEKKSNLINAKVLNFPQDKKIKNSKSFNPIRKNHWRINDISNDDQFRAVTGICLIFGFLLVMGLIANLTSL
tara:strand:- start:98 stop:349 length:252 start_codon:yes stop_codon:yes gene_type:complete